MLPVILRVHDFSETLMVMGFIKSRWPYHWETGELQYPVGGYKSILENRDDVAIKWFEARKYERFKMIRVSARFGLIHKGKVSVYSWGLSQAWRTREKLLIRTGFLGW